MAALVLRAALAFRASTAASRRRAGCAACPKLPLPEPEVMQKLVEVLGALVKR